MREIHPDRNVHIVGWYGGRYNVSSACTVTKKHMGVLKVQDKLPAPPGTFWQSLSVDAKDKIQQNRNCTLHDAVFVYDFNNANPGFDILLYFINCSMNVD